MKKITPRYLPMFSAGAMSVSVGMPLCVFVGVGLSFAVPVMALDVHVPSRNKQDSITGMGTIQQYGKDYREELASENRHTCESGLVSGRIRYQLEPFEPPLRATC